MAIHDITILNHLGNNFLRLYSKADVRIETMVREEYLHHAVIPLEKIWKLPYSDLPDQECFYRAFPKHKPGSAFCEKLAFLYYAMKENMQPEKMLRQYRAIMSRKQMTYRPNWDRYKKEFEEAKKKRARGQSHAGLRKFIEQLNQRDSEKALQLLKKKIAKTKEGLKNRARKRRGAGG